LRHWLGNKVVEMDKHIVAIGGGGFSEEPASTLLDDFILSLGPVTKPKVCFLPTASGDAEGYIAKFHDAFPPTRCRASHLTFFRSFAANWRGQLLEQDVIYVGGGSTVNMLAVWRVHGLDQVLRQAWNQGVVLCGLSAGSMCWFEAGLTDSLGPGLSPLRDGLSLLPGSHCPHYVSESDRPPAYRRFVGDGSLPPGLAVDDGAAAHFVGTELTEVVASRRNATAHRVDMASGDVKESPLEARYLGSK
jgi:dipeptidase E